MFTKAIVRRPCKNMVLGITESNLGKPDYENALLQHDSYIKALENCGLQVFVLEANEEFPDSVFVEDTAVLAQKCAIISNPGAKSRNKEIVDIKREIENHYSDVFSIHNPGTLDGGDVMMVGNHFYIGLSDRTNLVGAKAFIDILEKHDYSGSVVELKEVLHLKTGVNYIENNNMLVSGEFITKPEFEKYNKNIIPEGEEYAANSLWINNKVLVPKGFDKTRKLIEKLGYETIEVDVS